MLHNNITASGHFSAYHLSGANSLDIFSLHDTPSAVITTLFHHFIICHASCLSVPGPCEPEDLIDGIIFAANYLGSTQLLSERNPSKNIRMMQAQEAVSRVKVLKTPDPKDI